MLPVITKQRKMVSPFENASTENCPPYGGFQHSDIFLL